MTRIMFIMALLLHRTPHCTPTSGRWTFGLQQRRAPRTFKEHKLRGAAFIGENVLLPSNGSM